MHLCRRQSIRAFPVCPAGLSGATLLEKNKLANPEDLIDATQRTVFFL